MLGRKWRPLMLALVLVAVTLSGCADDGPQEEATDEAPEVEVTSDTGGIRGVVVDVSITPIAGATVTLTNAEVSVETDETGGFAFSKLEPGTYFVEATHPLYDTQQTSVEVVAGVADPQPIKMQLTRLIDGDPYKQTMVFQGHIVCSTNVNGLGYSEECGEGVGMPCSLPVIGPPPMACQRIGRSDASQPQIWFKTPADDPKSIIVEQHWEPSVSLATGNTEDFYTRLAIDWFCDPFCGGDSLGAVTAPSPLHIYVGPDVLESREITTETDLSTFTYSGAENGVILEQDFEEFITLSWGLPMPEDWSFIAKDPNPF